MLDVDGTKPVRLASLPRNVEAPFTLLPPAPAMAAMAGRLELSALRKLRLQGRLIPEGGRDWRLDAMLGATVVQPCVVTGAPVTTRIDAPLTRRYSADYRAPQEGDSEMPEDDSLDPLPEALSLMDVLEEALALELPAYPRAEGTAPAEITALPPGATSHQEETRKPFAGLAELRARLDATETAPDTAPDGEGSDKG